MNEQQLSSQQNFFLYLRNYEISQFDHFSNSRNVLELWMTSAVDMKICYD